MTDVTATATSTATAASPGFPLWILEYVNCIDSEISGLFGKGYSDLEKAAIDAISKGKRIRAILALLWCEALSGDYKPAAPVAVAYELAHAAALVQDDVIDGSNSRRGEKSIMSKYGIPGAILTSNTLLFQVPNMISGYGKQGVDTSTLCKLLDLLGDCYRSATLGEFLDLEMAEKDRVSEKEYSEMIRLKTGALIGASAASGAIVGGGLKDDQVIDAAYSFGESLGVAYQVQDDLLDLLGDESTIGKPIFTDLKGGKKSLALIHLFEHCSEEESKFSRSLLGKNTSYETHEVVRLRDLLMKYGSAEYARAFALRYIEKAEGKILSSVSDSKARSRLLELSKFLAARNY